MACVYKYQLGMFMYNMFDFNDKILYDVREGLFQCSYMYMYLSICVNE